MNVSIGVKEQQRFLIGIAGLSVFFAIVVAIRMNISSEEIEVSLVTNQTDLPAAVSDREVDGGDILTSANYRHQQSELPGIETSPKAMVADEVRAEIAKNGPKATAETVRDDISLLPARRKSKIEEVMRQWSRQNAEGAGSWIEEQLAEEAPDENFNQAALSGYIESIALVDPEAAAEAAELLEESVPEVKKEATSKIISGDPGFPGDRDFLTPDRE